jgi:hypothetical protein
VEARKRTWFRRYVRADVYPGCVSTLRLALLFAVISAVTLPGVCCHQPIVL